jgi:protein-disulfide isomerase
MRRRGMIAAGGAVLAGGIGAYVIGARRGVAAPAGDLTREAIFFDPGAPVLGNPHGTLPIAEFFDYRCPYCRGMHPMLQQLLAANPDIRFVAKEWPVFGGPSVTAARVALAANLQGKFGAVNDALFAAHIADDASVMQAARQAGADMARLEHDMKARASKIEDTLGTAAMQADGLGLQGTPGFIIGNYLIPGALNAENLARVVRDARGRLAGHAG